MITERKRITAITKTAAPKKPAARIPAERAITSSAPVRKAAAPVTRAAVSRTAVSVPPMLREVRPTPVLPRPVDPRDSESPRMVRPAPQPVPQYVRDGRVTTQQPQGMQREMRRPERREGNIVSMLQRIDMRYVIAAALLLVLVLIVSLTMGGPQSSFKAATPQTPEQLLAARDEILASIKRVAYVPADEVPKIAPIPNAEALAAQNPFFSGAITGDIVLIFEKSGRAIVYSPSRGLIINSAPIPAETQSPQQTQPQAPAQVEQVKPPQTQ